MTNQSSHLGEWPRPNSINDLFDAYKGAIVFLFLLTPVLAAFSVIVVNIFSKKTIGNLPHPLVIVAFIWYLTPFLVWCFSHISEVNLFKERYFIPKEAGLVVLVSFACHKVFESLGFLSCRSFARKFFPIFTTSILCLFLLFLHHRRSVFASVTQIEITIPGFFIMINSLPKISQWFYVVTLFSECISIPCRSLFLGG